MNKEDKKALSKFSDYVGYACGNGLLLLFYGLNDNVDLNPMFGAVIMAQAFGMFFAPFIKDRKKVGYLLVSLVALALSIFWTILYLK